MSAIPPAQESIAACHRFFTRENDRDQLEAAFDALTENNRGLVLIAGGLTARYRHREFEDFNDDDQAAILRGMQHLRELVRTVERKTGDIRRVRLPNQH